MGMTMSNQVRKAIDASGMSRYSIAKQSGVSEGMLSRFMSGENDVTLRTLEKIAPLIGVTLKVTQSKRQRKG